MSPRRLLGRIRATFWGLHEKWYGSTLLEVDWDSGRVLRIPGHFDLLCRSRTRRFWRGVRNLLRRS